MSIDEADNAMRYILKELAIETFEADTVIFKENDVSNNKAYVLLEGNVGIWKENRVSAFDDDFKSIQPLSLKKFEERSENLANSSTDSVAKMSLNPKSSSAKRYNGFKNQSSYFKSQLQNPKNTETNIYTIKTSEFGKNNEKTLKEPKLTKMKTQQCTENLSIDDTTIAGSVLQMPNENRVFSKFKVNKNDEVQKRFSQIRSSQDLSNFHEYSLPQKNLFNKNSEKSNAAILKNQVEFYNELYGDFLLELKRGFMFGEIALIENKNRAATVISTTNSICLVIKKEKFDLIKKIN